MIYYLGYYSCEKLVSEKRVAAPPAMNKMGYIISVISEIVLSKSIVISPCETKLNKFVKGSIQDLDDRISLKTFDSFNSKNFFVRCLGHLLTKTQLFLYLLTHITSNDTIIVYHSTALMRVVKIIKRIKKCKLIIEVEELYSDVRENEALRKREVKYLQIADQYIVITELLNKVINLKDKPRVISHGTYRAVPKCSEKFNDNKIHVVYAGSFNPIKGGAFLAIEAAEYLDEKYILHVLGRGSQTDTEAVIKKIEQVSLRSKGKIIYEGYKTGKDFDSFIQSCHIGLSTQQPDGKYNASSFPSKILMYMSNGLPVVSVRIPAVESSDIGSFIYYYDSPIPQRIADAIQSVPVGNYCCACEKLNELDEKFKTDISSLLV